MAVLAGAVYGLMAYHFVFFGRKVELLKKSTLTLNNTFVSPGDRKEIKYKGIESLIGQEDLRKAGLGELLVEKGLITADELAEAEEKIDYGN